MIVPHTIFLKLLKLFSNIPESQTLDQILGCQVTGEVANKELMKFEFTKGELEYPTASLGHDSLPLILAAEPVSQLSLVVC